MLNEKLQKEWNKEKNTSLKLDPMTCPPFFQKKVEWVCKKGHEWSATVASRSQGNGCPYCSGLLPIIGETDLATTHPNLASEWHPTKNKDLRPSDVTAGCNEYAYWKCSDCGHTWEAQICSRTNKKHPSGCPKCHNQTSFPEQALFFYIQKVFPDAQNRAIVYGKELDVYIPSENAGVEYNGYWHKGKEKKDNRKIISYKNKGINVFIIKESKENCVCGENTVHYVYSTDHKHLKWAIEKLFELMGLPVPDVDIVRDGSTIRQMYRKWKVEHSLAKLYPDIAAEWHPSKNGLLTADMVTPGSGEKPWWKCSKCGYEWPAYVYRRVGSNNTKGTGCPCCNNKVVVPGKNDLETIHPELCKEWDYDKNGDLKPDMFLPRSNKRIHWKCPYCGNERHTPIGRRTQSDDGICRCRRKKSPLTTAT